MEETFFIYPIPLLFILPSIIRKKLKIIMLRHRLKMFLKLFLGQSGRQSPNYHLQKWISKIKLVQINFLPCLKESPSLKKADLYKRRLLIKTLIFKKIRGENSPLTLKINQTIVTGFFFFFFFKALRNENCLEQGKSQVLLTQSPTA